MERLGLCLTGGGARGAYQAGALKALEELGYLDKVYAISGTSIGSVNASLLASRSVDEIKELWLNYPASDFNKDTSIFKTIRERKMDIVNQGVYEINALEKLLEENIDIQKLKKHKVYVTLSPAGMENEGVMGLLKSSFKHYIKNESQVIYSPLHEQNDEDINKQILASCSIPFVFPSVKMEGQQVFDGGLYDNAPVKPLIDAGCDSIIVINVSFNPIYEVHNDIEICYGDSALINNFWYHADGYYTFVLPTVQGCDSVVVTHLIVNPLPQTPIATQANNIIYSSSPTGNQWYSSQGLIIGAVNQVYIPNCSDTYYVIVTDSNGCSSNASNEIQFVFTSISDFSNKRLSIYPNPAKQILNITSENENIKTVKIFNIYGQELMCVNQEFDNGINVEILSNGIYVLEIETDDQVWTYKFIKQ